MTKELKESDAGSPSPNVLRIILALRKWGWGSFWSQLVLAIIASIILIATIPFANRVASSPTSGTVPSSPGIGMGIIFTVIGLLVVYFSAFWSFRYTRFAQKLRGNGEKPSKVQTVQLLKMGAIVSLTGMPITLIGANAIVGALTIKSLTPQTGGFNQIISVQPIDMLVVQACILTILAHFVNLFSSLWLLNRVSDKPTN
ncbi:MAG: DUF3611 family protein [Pseudanabaena sp. RU_4_16]|nr:DUF3611 family protein [Pseudanabaena sp. RU_4_16]NKB17787.1 DUF3611 family protein [Pseudanabaena sp. CRU_2_10]